MARREQMSTGVSILGSTGSIGCNALRVVESLSNHFHIVGLGARRNIDKLAEQIARHKPEVVTVEDESCADRLLEKLAGQGVEEPKIVLGEAGLVEVATLDGAECVVSATVGAVGFVPTLRALEAGKRVALANKETLVMAGELMTKAAESSSAELLPIDSEHNALHQCLRGEKKSEVRRLFLTASGGPFRTKSRDKMARASVAEAMQHPTWNMGSKITIDSATLMNKGLEVIEAHWLFGFEPDQIEILVHPESVVHSMIELIDGSVIAQMGVTDMRHAIQYALTYPRRYPCPLPVLNLTELSGLHFETPDLEKFPCISLAYRALKVGGTLPAAMNAANEAAVQAFIGERISLTDIPDVISEVMDSHSVNQVRDLDSVIRADHEARESANKVIERISGRIDALVSGV